MGIVRLKWRRRSNADEQRVYRSDIEFGAGSLPAPLAVLSATATEYVDEDAPAGTVFYGVGAVLNGSPDAVALSGLVSLVVEADAAEGVTVNGSSEAFLYDGSALEVVWSDITDEGETYRVAVFAVDRGGNDLGDALVDADTATDKTYTVAADLDVPPAAFGLRIDVFSLIGSVEMQIGESFNLFVVMEPSAMTGWWWDANLVAEIYQDAGATTALAADGNPVGFVKDQSAF